MSVTPELCFTQGELWGNFIGQTMAGAIIGVVIGALIVAGMVWVIIKQKEACKK